MLITRFVSIVLILVGLSGCGTRMSTLSGKVSYKGQPVVYGSVVALARNKQSFQGAIQADGSYAIHGIPRDIGELSVSVHSPNPNPTSPRPVKDEAKGIRRGRALSTREPQPHPVSGNWFAIPEKYTKFEEAGLSVTIDREAVTYDIDLQ